MKDRIWTKGDGIAGLTAGTLALAVYAWTVAPNVTLLDSGEFMVAAQHFGVPHPTGYPLWTLLAWLFQLLPLGNAAWEINFFSSVCGALAVALCTALTRSTLRWLFGEDLMARRGLASMVAISCGLMFAFSFSMWSQATIAEVYTLHALLIGAFLTVIYVFLRNPQSLALLMLSFFLLALSFSNHHLTIVMAVIPFFAVLLVRRDIIWELLVASVLTVLLAYLGFAILSSEPLILKTAIRFFYCVALGFVIFVIVRKFDLDWRLIAFLPFVVALGLLPYAYMPIASSTNPPMNWAYTKTPEGFFFSFNRSQYSGSLSQQSLRSVGRLVGTSAPKRADESGPPDPMKQSMLAQMQSWTGFFWLQLAASFTPVGIIGYFAALLVILRLRDVSQRTWVYVLEIAFVLAAILQPLADGAEIDAAGWWLQMPFHTYTNLIFAVLAAVGIAVLVLWLVRRAPRLAWLRFGLLILPVMPLVVNYDGASQRDRWFGWEFGHDMLKDLPPDSVVFGGTDPGRFVPTYMILGESSQPAGVKRDPSFDRRDLFIITQNGVGEPLYRKYIADHYGKDRPAAKTAFERWLGRAEAYPKKTLDLPTEEEIQAAFVKELKTAEEAGGADPSLAHSIVTRLIWEKNRDKHSFFVEESFPLQWSYDHALPHGLVYEIKKEPLKEIPADVVAKDMAFWTAYIEKLLANPDFRRDFDAQRSFSKLRSTTASLYKHRKMARESEVAYRQALELWPGNPESLNQMTALLWDRGDENGAIELLSAANAGDPNNVQLWRLRLVSEKRKELAGEIKSLKEAIKNDPNDRHSTEKLLDLSTSLADTNQVATVLAQALVTFAKEPEFLKSAVSIANANQMPDVALEAGRAWAAADPESADAQIVLAQAAVAKNDRSLFFESARRAIEKGGLPMRDALAQYPDFAKWKDDPEFKELVNPVTQGKKPSGN